MATGRGRAMAKVGRERGRGKWEDEGGEGGRNGQGNGKHGEEEKGGRKIRERLGRKGERPHSHF